MYDLVSTNIVEFTGDAILNSLGYGKDRIIDAPGGIFRSILDAVGKKADDLKAEIYKQGKSLAVTKGFLTGSYGLPCGKIVHVVTPFREDDDEDLNLLRKAYLNAFQLAYDAGIRTICVPLIGSRANGYKPGHSLIIARKAAHAFASEHDDFCISISLYWKENPRGRRAESSLRSQYPKDFEEERWERSDENGRRFVADRKTYYWPQPGTPIEADEINMDGLELKIGDSFGRLIDLFIIARDGEEDKQSIDGAWTDIQDSIAEIRSKAFNEKGGSGTNFKNSWHKHADAKLGIKKTVKRGEEEPNGVWSIPGKLQILFVAATLGMDKKQAEFLFRFCGYYLSKFSEEDLTIKSCLPLLDECDSDDAILNMYRIYTARTGKIVFTVKKKDDEGKVKKEAPKQ